MAKLKKIEDFDTHQKSFTLQQIIDILPTEKEGEKYISGSTGYPEDTEEATRIDEYERGFVSGVEWLRYELIKKLKEN
jgi:hypothetical protein